MKVIKPIPANPFFKCVFGENSFAAFMLSETLRDFLYLGFKITNILMKRRVRRLQRLVFQLQRDGHVLSPHVVQEALGYQGGEHGGNESCSVDGWVNGQEREFSVALKVMEKLKDTRQVERYASPATDG